MNGIAQHSIFSQSYVWVLLILWIAIGSACEAEPDTASREQYLVSTDEIQQAFTLSLEHLVDGHPALRDASAATASTKEVLRQQHIDYYGEAVPIAKKARAEVAALVPPSKARDYHAKLLGFFDLATQMFVEGISSLEDEDPEGVSRLTKRTIELDARDTELRLIRKALVRQQP
jgi:hypothetical protein